MLFEEKPEDWQLSVCRISDVGNKSEAICILVLLLLQLIIFAVILYYTFVMKKIRAPRSVLVFVYGVMILWATVFATQYILSLISYHLNQEVEMFENYSHAFLNITPRFILAFDLAAAILIQTLLLIVPYFWIRNIIYFLEHSDEIQSKGTKIFNRITKFYIIITRIAVGALIFTIFFIPGRNIIPFNRGLRTFIIAEAALTVFYLLVAFGLLKQKLKKIAEVSSSKTILCQGIVIIIICFARCVQNIVMTFAFGKLRDFKQDLCMEEAYNMKYTWDLLVGIIAMHFIPIIIILYIYKPASQQEKYQRNTNNQSLISTT